MPNEPKNPKAPEPEKSTTEQTEKNSQMKRIADEAAAKGRKTAKRYDRQHGTFPRGGPSGMA